MWSMLKSSTQSIFEKSKQITTSALSLSSSNRSEVQKLLESIEDSKEEIISTQHLKELSGLTYDMEKFEQTLDLIVKRLKTFQYDIDEAKKSLNVLIATNYLIKHGASGFVDELRSMAGVFKKYQQLKDLKTYEDEQLQKELSYELEKIKSRARHIEELLSDKDKLFKEKELAMLVKQKMMLYEKNMSRGDMKENLNKSISNAGREERLKAEKARLAAEKNGSTQTQISSISSESQKESGVTGLIDGLGKTIKNNIYGGESGTENGKGYSYAEKMEKLDGYLEKYLWKYIDKLDGKVEVVSEKIMKNFDKYMLNGESPPEGGNGGSLFDEEDEGDSSNKAQQKGSGKKMMKEVEFHEHDLLGGESDEGQKGGSQKYQSLLDDEDDDELMKKLESEARENDRVEDSMPNEKSAESQNISAADSNSENSDQEKGDRKRQKNQVQELI